MTTDDPIRFVRCPAPRRPGSVRPRGHL